MYATQPAGLFFLIQDAFIGLIYIDKNANLEKETNQIFTSVKPI